MKEEKIEELFKAIDTIKDVVKSFHGEEDAEHNEAERNDNIPEVSFKETVAGIMTSSREELGTLKVLVNSLINLNDITGDIAFINRTLGKCGLPKFCPEIKEVNNDSIYD